MKTLLPLFSLFVLSCVAWAGDLALVQTISLEGAGGRIDHFSFDSARHRLFLAALGNDTVEVLDLAQQKRERTLSGFGEPQGIAVGAAINRVLVANAKDGVCHLFDAETLTKTGTVDLKDDADNVRYDPATKLFWVGYASGALAAIDAEKNQVVAHIKLTAHPESFQMETKGARIFVNVPKAHEVAVIDREKKAVVVRWPLKEASSNFPMALDESHHRLFIGCRNPAKMVVLDTESGGVVASVSVVSDADDIWFDPVRQRVYVSGGGGFVTVISQIDADHYAAVGKVATASGARTSFFDPESRNLYVAVPHRLTQQAEVRIYHTADH